MQPQYVVDDYVQILNHSDPACNGQYGYVRSMTDGQGTPYYTVELEDMLDTYCVCTEDELMEG
jgi:hypothetical protein